jgi:hypothetical protein
MGSVILFARKKHLLSGLVLGVSFLIYPLYAFAFFPVIVLYSIIYEKQVWLRNVLVVFFAAAPFGIPWLFSYISSPYFFGVYGCINKILGAVVLPSIALSLGIPLFFMLYSMRKRIKIVYGKFYGALWLFSLVLVSLSEISQSYWASGMDFLGIVKLAGSFYPLLEIPFYIMFAHLVWMVFKNRRNIESGHLFFMGWLFVISLLLFTPPTIAPWVPMKLIVVITIPASFIAAIGIGEFSARYKISWRKIMALIIVFSLPAIFLYYAFEITRTGMVQKDFVQQNMFYSKSDYDAMLFLKNQPDGIVLCSGYIGNFLPYYSGKKSLLFGIDRTDTVYRFDEKMSDYKKFMAGDAEVLKKYNIGYVFYGSFEKLDGKIIDDSLLEKIYDLNGAIIYRVG